MNRTKRALLWGALLILFGMSIFILWQKQALSPLVVSQQRETTPFLTTVYRNKQIYEKAFAEAAPAPQTKVPLALITSHHLLAAPLIARSYANVAGDEIKRILLVSPDHFQLAYPEGVLAYTTNASWDALFGVITPDRAFINQLAGQSNIVNTRNPFLREHGVYTEAPFLQHYFPQASIVPLIVKNTNHYEDFQALGKELSNLSQDADMPTLLVVSSDFSHHATHTTAQAQDKKSISVLQNLRQAQFSQLENDCRSCIAVLSGYLGVSSEQVEFHLLENKDSTDFGGEDRDVTSYVTGYFSEDQNALLDSASRETEPSILFGGDLMFDRSIRTRMRKYGDAFPLAPLQETLKEADLVVANLEGPITDNSSRSETSAIGARDNYFFTFDPSVAGMLKDFHIEAVNLGNNHISNFGEAGLRSTEKYLAAAGVKYFGAPVTDGSNILFKTIKGIKIALVNYDQFIPQGKEKAFADIITARQQADVVILYTHWGTEYIPATEAIKDLAHEFIDAGADLIIGSHPHVVQEKEVYQGKVIYYSLGNMVFDQYFSKDTEHGLLVKVTLDSGTKNFTFEDMPIVLMPSGQSGLVRAE